MENICVFPKLNMFDFVFCVLHIALDAISFYWSLFDFTVIIFCKCKVKFWETVSFGQLFIFVNFILQTVLDEATEPWGIKVERVEM